MNPSLIAQVVARIAGLGLAALMTVTVLSGVGHMADHQYRDAVLAQSPVPMAPTLVVATNDQPGQ